MPHKCLKKRILFKTVFNDKNQKGISTTVGESHS